MRKLTAVDVQKITGYSRDQLRGLLDELPEFAGLAPSARVAREFTPHDLIVLGVITVLERKIGLRRRAIIQLSSSLRTTLSGPKKVDRTARLLLTFDPISTSYVAGTTVPKDGVVISLGPIFERVDEHLGSSGGIAISRQAHLRLSPVLVRAERKRKTG